MPAEIQAGSSGTSFVDVLTAFVTRLRTAYVERVGFVRVVASPENRLPQYKAEEGLSVYVSSPRPKPKDGAGRYGRNTFRDIVVIVATQSLADEAGSDEAAVRAHIAIEEVVTNVCEHVPPADLAYSSRIGIWCEWVEGGEDITRQMKIDPGMLVSALRFRINYQTPMQVYRA